MEKKWSYLSLEPHLLNLRWGGYFQIDPSSPPTQRFIHSIYSRMILILTIVYTTQQIIKVYHVREELHTVMETMFLLLTHFDSIYKEVVLLVQANQVQRLIDIMKGELFNQREKEHEILLQKTAREAKTILRISNITALVTCFLWIVYPLTLFLQGKEVIFAIWFPFEVNKSPVFFIVLMYVWVQTSWLAYNNTTIDVLISFLLEQCTTQVNILRFNLESIVQKCKKASIHRSESLDNLFDVQFKNILFHHHEIIKFFNMVEDIFGGAILCQFLFSGWILCATGYRLVAINIASIEFLSMILYLICMLTELFFYCFYGSRLVNASEKLMESAYFMDWLEISVTNRKHLILFMERLKRPIVPTAKIIVPLSNATFVSVVRSSYTFYAFLKNTE